MVMRKIVVVGDKSNSDGTILPNANSTFSVGDAGHKVALIGGPVQCLACKSVGTIAKASGPRRMNFMGEVALEDDIVACGCLQGAYSDLLVLGQSAPSDQSGVNADTVPYVVINSGCPVLVVPDASAHAKTGSRVLIAWNGSIEARRAVHDAIPLLKRARTVEVAVFNPKSPANIHGQLPGADISLYLARHGINIDVKEEVVKTDIGEALLSLAANLNSDLLVMGCYGHSRFRETLLGGVTHTILKSMTLPVLMSH
ncbi:universal stress protein [Collimonas humicola]|uniref:universal stress protein n=1 Tax=Collimonas humicola TaxID=2825886 RepID=UPI001B8C43F9|nr:universal stress protein [Collimonas humicola]